MARGRDEGWVEEGEKIGGRKPLFWEWADDLGYLGRTDNRRHPEIWCGRCGAYNCAPHRNLD